MARGIENTFLGAGIGAAEVRPKKAIRMVAVSYFMIAVV